MKLRIGINGFGRIGRTVARINALCKMFDLVVINDINPDIKNLAYLFKYDSTWGTFPGLVECREHNLIINDECAKIFSFHDIREVPWQSAGVDIVIDASGVSKNVEHSHAIIERNIAKKVIVTQCHKSVDQTIIFGVNEDKYDPLHHHVVSSSICDANAIAPVMKYIDQIFGIESGFVTTLHPWLSYQKLVDLGVGSHSYPGLYWKDYSLGRASVGSLIPKDTTAVTATIDVLPQLSGKIDAVSYRVPIGVVASADLNINLRKKAKREEVIQNLQNWVSSVKVVDLNYESLVSVDYERNTSSCVIDMQWIKLLRGQFLKLILWYDNEWGYSSRVLDLCKLLISP